MRCYYTTLSRPFIPKDGSVRTSSLEFEYKISREKLRLKTLGVLLEHKAKCDRISTYIINEDFLIKKNEDLFI